MANRDEEFYLLIEGKPYVFVDGDPEQEELREWRNRSVHDLDTSNRAGVLLKHAVAVKLVLKDQTGRLQWRQVSAGYDERTLMLARATRWLKLAELLVPARLRQEEIGDALEVINRIVAAGEPGWGKRVVTKVISTFFWVLVNAVRELAVGIFGKKSA